MTPTYAWQIPTLIKEWLLQTIFVDVEHVWFVMNCGDSIGKADRYNQELCEKKNWTYMGTAQIVMPENYIAMFPVPDEKEAGKIIEAAEPAIEQAVSCIQMTKKFPDRKGHFWDGLFAPVRRRRLNTEKRAKENHVIIVSNSQNAEEIKKKQKYSKNTK